MEDSLYDEFGNYIGPELRSSDEEDSQSEASDSDRGQSDDEQVRENGCESGSGVVAAGGLINRVALVHRRTVMRCGNALAWGSTS